MSQVQLSRDTVKMLRAAGRAILKLGYTDDRPDDKTRLEAAVREAERVLLERKAG